MAGKKKAKQNGSDVQGQNSAAMGDAAPAMPRFSKVMAALAFIGLVVILAIALFRGIPDTWVARRVMPLFCALCGAAFLGGILNSAGAFSAKWWGVAINYTGSAAIAFGLLFALPWIEKSEYAHAVVYSLRPDSGTDWKAVEVIPPPGQAGKTVQLYRHVRSESDFAGITVVFPPDTTEARLLFKLQQFPEKTVTVRRDDAARDRTIIHLPSGVVE